MNAKEAYRKATENCSIKPLLDQIVNAANRGQCSIKVDTLSEIELVQLQELGYKTWNNYPPNALSGIQFQIQALGVTNTPLNVTISWAHATPTK